jgi:hypothetical protein
MDKTKEIISCIEKKVDLCPDIYSLIMQLVEEVPAAAHTEENHHFFCEYEIPVIQKMLTGKGV